MQKKGGPLHIGKAKVADVITSRTTGTQLEATTTAYQVVEGLNKITLNEPLEIAEDETIVLGGSGSVGLYVAKNVPTNDEAGNIAIHDFVSHDELLNATGDYADTLAVEVKAEFLSAEKPIFENIMEDAFRNSGSIGGSNDVTLSTGPFVYQDLALLAGKHITKIGVPVKGVSATDANQKFTVYIYKNTMEGLTTSSVSTHTLYLPAESLSSTSVNDWVYVDCDIQLKDDETLAFGASDDNVIWGYISDGDGNNFNKSHYTFYAEVGSNARSGAGSGIYFDIYYEEEQNLETHLEYLEQLEQKVTEQQQIEALKEALQGKKLSVLGDSISTFEGWSNNYTDYNSTMNGNAVYYKGSTCEVTDVSMTWWHQILEKIEMDLCVNNSYSGDTVAGRGQTRCVQLHDDTHEPEQEDTQPEIIAVYLGINDYNQTQTAADSFKTSYNAMISKIKEKYADAEVFLFTYLPNKATSRPLSDLLAYNDAVKDAAEQYGCHIVDLYADSGITEQNLSENMGDPTRYVHPNPVGMEKIADCFWRALYNFYVGE